MGKGRLFENYLHFASKFMYQISGGRTLSLQWIDLRILRAPVERANLMLSSEMPAMQQAAVTSSFAWLMRSNAVWLRNDDPLYRSTMRLMDHSRYAGLELDICAYRDLALIPFWRYDLVLLEQSRGQDIATLTSAIKRVRQLSQAPLIVLTRRLTPELTLAGLHAGADSVSLLQSSNRVMLAHWSAMLRRWKPLS